MDTSMIISIVAIVISIINFIIVNKMHEDKFDKYLDEEERKLDEWEKKEGL